MLCVSSFRLLVVWLACVLLQTVVPHAEACQYCRMAATDPESAKLAAQMHSGGFPLDATINQFQPGAPSATLMAPPSPGSVTTRAADLPGKVPRPADAPAAPAINSKHVAASASPRTVEQPVVSLRWADVGLFGLLAAGGWFYWRTRRVSAPVA